jgi:hypothetical protein
MQRMMKKMGGAGSKKALSKSRKGKKRKGPGGGRVTARGGPATPMPDLAAELEAQMGRVGGARSGGGKLPPADDLTLPGLP